MKILIDHIGYEINSSKQAIAACTVDESFGSSAVFTILKEGEAVYEGSPGKRLEVEGWKGRFFYLLDFSPVAIAGNYNIRIEDESISLTSPEFLISERLVLDNTVSDILYYYKSQRSSWRWDKADAAAPFIGERSDRVDVSGGWFDASGDYSKYLTHLSYSNYLNPQQTPLVVWSLLSTSDFLSSDEKHKGTLIEERALEEGVYGADFLVRMQDPDGYFYMTVFDQWSKDEKRRTIAAFSGMNGVMTDDYHAAYRQGGGMAVAALAKASRCKQGGEYSTDDYLAAAVRGFEHLEANNLHYLNNGRENIIDDYCALLAAVELYKSTAELRFLEAARFRADRLNKLYSIEAGYWLVEAGSDRPFFHAAETGLPIIALIDYCGIETDPTAKATASQLIKTAVIDILKISGSCEGNPFMLAKQWVKAVDGPVKQAFFVPHENETGYWWQGENARLASIAAAVRRARVFFTLEPDTVNLLDDFADAQLHWILGRNPYDMCMMQGHGRNNPRYEEHYPNAPGGICNGITGGFEDEEDLDFLPESVSHRGDHRWRWSEQWIPHAAWFLLAVGSCE